MKLKLIFALVVVIAALSNVNAQQTVKVTPKLTGYLEYLPQGYNSNTNKYPIVISLHGIKEKGTTSTNINDIKAGVAKVANVGLPKYVKYGQQYPFILISPQLKSNMGRWTGDYVVDVINYVKTYLRVDPSRIYLTGLSLGGGGVISVAAAHPNVFAGILPICMGYNVITGAQAIALSDVPSWGFHGDRDAIVSEAVTINMINAINKYKPSPLGKVTIFPGAGHVCWDKVYKETTALTWLLSCRNGSGTTTPPPPVTNASPIAKAGIDKTITLPTNYTTLAGSATDSDGTIASYTWVKKSGGAASLSGTTSASMKASNLVAGTYVFTLTVKDNKGASDSDDVVVVVKSSTGGTVTNVAPIANSGANKTIYLPTTATTIYGSGKDTDGSIASYTWSMVRGGRVTMSGTTGTALKLSGLAAGNYVFRLTVKDNKGAVDTDDMLLVVRGSTIASN
jgi:hypothetical protein